MNDIDSNLKKNNSRNNKNNHNNNYDDDVDGDNVHDRNNDDISAILVVIERKKLPSTLPCKFTFPCRKER